MAWPSYSGTVPRNSAPLHHASTSPSHRRDPCSLWPRRKLRCVVYWSTHATAGRSNHQINLADVFKSEKTATEQILSSAFIGFAVVDLQHNPLTFRTINDRPIDKGHVAALIENFKTEGLQNCSEDTAIPVGMRKSWLDTAKTISAIRGKTVADVPRLTLTGEGKTAANQGLIRGYSGAHRVEANTQFARMIEDQAGREKKEDDQTVGEIKEKIRLWAIAIFDLGAQIDLFQKPHFSHR
jgi:hypothetical protein